MTHHDDTVKTLQDTIAKLEAQLAEADAMANAMQAILKMMDHSLQGTGRGDMAIKPDHSMNLSDAWKLYSRYKRNSASITAQTADNGEAHGK